MELSRSILWTLHYFDIFDYPLTSFEVWKYLWSQGQEITYSDACNALDQLCRVTRQSPAGHPRVTPTSRDLVDVKDGFYFLFGRAETIQKRKEQFQISKRKIDKAKKLARVFQYIPYLRGIFLCNKVAQGIAIEESDIDLFIITEKREIWTVRFFTLFILKILGLRPKDKKKSDKFCLCFYVDRENLSLEKFMLPPHPSLPSERGGIEGGVPDIHYIYWLSAFLPLYDGGATKEFIAANQWITEYLPNVQLTEESSFSFSSKPFIKILFERLMDVALFGQWIEKALRILQLKIMPRELKNMAEESNTNVLILDGVVKLHANDRREEYREKFTRALN